MTEYFDDNYGHWNNMDGPDMHEYYRKVQKESVWKKCSICGRRVKIKREYDKCNSCCEKIERGMDI